MLGFPPGAPRIALTREQMVAFDRAAIEAVGVPSLVLMESAGRALAAAALAHLPAGPIGVLAGPGNNGGDGLVAARLLANAGRAVAIAIVGDVARASPDFRHQRAIAERLGLGVVESASGELGALAGAAGLVDALFGTGLRRVVGGPERAAIEAANALGLPIVAADLPSGIDASTGQVLGTAIRATRTVTFGLPKLGLLLHPGRAHAGAIEVADIGLPYARAPGGVGILGPADRLPPRPADGHKGTFGHLLVVAGHRDRPGAALLTARAALRAGAGLVTLAAEEDVIARLAPALVEIMGASLGPAPLSLGRLDLGRATALAIGPSLEPSLGLADELHHALAATPLPAVLDAGALDLVAPALERLRGRSGPTVLTPHPGEAARLLGVTTAEIQADRAAAARGLAARAGAEVVLKGATTLIASPDGRIDAAIEGNPGMGTGGVGDVLTGVIGALLAQRVDAPRAARIGARAHARAGDLAAGASSKTGVVASDLLAGLGPALEGEA